MGRLGLAKEAVQNWIHPVHYHPQTLSRMQVLEGVRPSETPLPVSNTVKAKANSGEHGLANSGGHGLGSL